MKVNTEQAVELLIDCAKAKLVPFLQASPGVGKSAIIQQIADKFSLKLIDLRLSQCDVTDLNGFPSIDKESGKSSYLPMDTFPLEGDRIPKGYNGWLLFLDEMNSAPLSVQASAYKLVLDRAIGHKDLHEDVVIMCAGNLATDGAIVNRVGTAMQSRLIHLELEVDSKAWLNWAASNEIDHRIQSFISYMPDKLHMFNPKHDDKTFACPRTWEFLSKLTKPMKQLTFNKLPLITGTIGEGVGNEFFTYCEIYKDLITVDQIAKNPKGIQVPEEPSVQYALAGSLASHCNDQNVDALIQFIERMPLEIQIVVFRMMIKKYPALSTIKSFKKWMAENYSDIV